MDNERLQLVVESLISIARSMEDLNTILKEVSDGLVSIETAIDWLKKDKHGNDID